MGLFGETTGPSLAPRSRLGNRAVELAIALAVLLPAVAGADQPRAFVFEGSSLVDALSELESRGLAIVYSSALVRPDMAVAEEPTAADPRRILDQVLAPHGLVAWDAPGGTIVVVEAVAADQAAGAGVIRGVVAARGGPLALAGVTVTVEGTGLSAEVAADGRFRLDNVPAGEHSVTAHSSGVLRRRVDGVRVRSGGTTRIRLELAPLSVFLDEVVITPSHFRLLDEQPESRQFLSRDQVDRMPHAADDLYRAVKRLPGAAGGDYSATFNVRGGEQEELLVILDGVELYEPYHLKDFQSVFSIVDAEAVGGVDFLTGGFPVEYGDRMSGVMDISMATPSGPTSTTLAVSTLNARLVSAGSFADDRGGWMVSGRAWYPEDVLKATGAVAEEILADYYDLVAKVERRVGERSTLSANLLFAYDDLGFQSQDEGETERVTARYQSHQLWLNLRTDWSAGLSSQTVLSGGRIHRRRYGGVDDVVEGTIAVNDDRTFHVLGLRQDWNLELADRHVLKFGFDVKRQEAAYDYRSTTVVIDPEGGDPPEVNDIEVDLDPEGESYGLYLADRFRPLTPLIVEIGMRWDKQFWIDDQQLSPRVNLMCSVGRATTLRAAFGRFYQSERLNELQVEDGVQEFAPAQLAEHWLVSVEHRFSDGIGLRAEAYRKDLSDLRPRYENMFNPLELFPENREDRILLAPEHGRAQGFEILLRSAAVRPVTWWVSYALARTEDRIDGDWQPRSWDQRHAATFGLNLDLPAGWNLSLAGTYHTGFPTTEVTAALVEGGDGELAAEPVFGPRNGARFPSYRRFDLRASKRLAISNGELTLIFEVINLFNHENPCCVEDFVLEVEEDGSVAVIRAVSSWAPIVPSLGVRWRF